MLTYLTAGESHGKGLSVIVEGLPAGVPISAEKIDAQLSRRQKGYGRGGRMKIEADQVEITAGIRHGKTLGSPVALWVKNRDWQSWKDDMSFDPVENFISRRFVDAPRPGHADLNGGLKYSTHDLRDILERASARETTMRVSAGALARQLLENFQIQTYGHVVCIGGVSVSSDRPPWDEIAARGEVDPVRCYDEKVSQQMIKKIDEAKKKGDTVGGIFEIAVLGLPPGLGSHVHWNRKLDGRLAQAVMSIQAIKGVEIGLGFEEANRFGSKAHDEIFYNSEEKKFYRKTNRAGGLEGGMTNGETLLLRGVMKPISTLYTPLHSVNIKTKEEITASVERSDTCAVPAACVIAENIVAFEITSAFLEKFGGDSLTEIRRNYDGFLEQIKNY